MLDLIGHIGYALLFIGIILIGRKRIEGWIFRFIGEAIWIILGIKLGLTSIWMWGAVFLIVECYNYYRWKHDKTNK